MTDVQSEPVTIPAARATLAGTVLRPAVAEARPGVLLLADRGVHDRDGRPAAEWPEPDLPPDRLSLLPDLAALLARSGLVTLRYDKRGTGASTGDWDAADLEDLSEDAAAALAVLAAHPAVAAGHLAIAGHGEGAYLAARLAARRDDVRALVLLSPPAQSLDRALLARAEREAAAIAALPPAQRLLEGIPADYDPVRAAANLIDALLASNERVLSIGGTPYKVDWFRQSVRAEPADAYRRVRCPVLILQGGDDEFTAPDAVETVAAMVRAGGNQSVAVAVLPGKDRAYRAPATGAAPGGTAPEVLGRIADWLTAQLNRERNG